jgi:hypothetical protein
VGERGSVYLLARDDARAEEPDELDADAVRTYFDPQRHEDHGDRKE